MIKIKKVTLTSLQGWLLVMYIDKDITWQNTSTSKIPENEIKWGYKKWKHI